MEENALKLAQEQIESIAKGSSPSPLAIILLALLSGGLGNVGISIFSTDYASAAHNGKETTERKAEDRDIRREIKHLSEDYQELKSSVDESGKEVRQSIEWIKQQLWQGYLDSKRIEKS